MICCVTGHRPKGFPFNRDDDNELFKKYIEKLYDEIGLLIWKGYDTFLTGMAEGADIDFAYSVIEYKLLYPEIHLEAALPYPYAAPKRKTAYSVDKEHILSACDSVHIISPVYHHGCMDKRNRFMADKADTVLAVWNGIEKGGTWNTICYARKIGKPVRYIMLHDLDRLFF